ncbi:cofilin/actin-depolymerizing factor homolog [Drosophila obscura]|uniref:cofilin/actin-depolymerizing factor homolog n=1 Tax=Drosophila obscura TaxID=7282 RepID=UPI000BA0D07F|nr:cofilin/actin-depolymerizing factor homolog [Drosophila obscura]
MLLSRNIRYSVSVDATCQTFYEQLQNYKLYRYLIFYIRTDNVMDIEKIGTRRCSYEQFLNDLRKCGTGDCRIGICDMEYRSSMPAARAGSSLMGDRPLRGSLLLVQWSPEGACNTKRTLYESGLKSLRDALGECQVLIKATTTEEATLAQVVEQCRSRSRSGPP